MTHGDEHYITTISGRKFWPLDPRAEDIEIGDIAHALSMICRYNGHVRAFYSVAQHSVIVSRFVEPGFALYGLLHDAAEAYLGDMTRWVKHDPQLAAFRERERHLLELIYQRFGLTDPEPSNVKVVDVTIMQDEVRDVALNAHNQPAWMRGSGLGVTITPWPPVRAEREFLQRFFELLRARENVSVSTLS